MSQTKTKFFTKFDRPIVKPLENTKPTCTIAGYARQCDINNMFKIVHYDDGTSAVQYTGIPLDCQPKIQEAQYGDFTMFTPEKLSASMELVSNAKSMFNQLPSYLRSRFDNNPGKLLEFLSDSKNRDEAVKLGLVKIQKVIDSSTNLNNPSNSPNSSEVTPE